jgi:hypothetical protein
MAQEGQVTQQGVMMGLATLNEVDATWRLVGVGLSDACKRTGGDISAHDLYRMCRVGDAYLVVWVAPKGGTGACVVTVENWEAGRWLRLMALYGKNYRSYKKDLWRFLAEMADHLGASGLITEGRPGWERYEPDLEPIKTIYRVKRENVK